jgi:hypothetical protein
MNPKMCKHKLSEGTCSLCLGIPRSPEARGYAESTYHRDLPNVFIKNEQEIFESTKYWDDLTNHDDGGEA